jgi:hypothetical protein
MICCDGLEVFENKVYDDADVGDNDICLWEKCVL